MLKTPKIHGKSMVFLLKEADTERRRSKVRNDEEPIILQQENSKLKSTFC
jgi:hypothetical protein